MNWHYSSIHDPISKSRFGGLVAEDANGPRLQAGGSYSLNNGDKTPCLVCEVENERKVVDSQQPAREAISQVVDTGSGPEVPQPPQKAESGLDVIDEEWRVYPHNSYYEVSTLGRVRNSDTKRILVLQKNQRDDYLRVHMCRGGGRRMVPVHRAVAQTFIPPVDGKPLVLHNDGRCDNNVATNLRWGTYKENSADRVRHGRARGPTPGFKPFSKAEVREVMRLHRAGLSQVEIGEAIGRHQVSVGRVIKRALAKEFKKAA